MCLLICKEDDLRSQALGYWRGLTTLVNVLTNGVDTI